MALLITALAVFGLLSFLLDAMRESRQAVLHAQAGFYLTDMLERIRANPSANYEIDFGQKPSMSGGCESQTCQPEAMANYELAQWKCALSGSAASVCADAAANADVLALCQSIGFETGCLALPKGDGQIRAINNGYEIKVRWRPLAAALDEYDEISLSAML